MARFSGSIHEQFTTAAPPDRARAHFADLAQIQANFGPLERGEQVGERTLSFVLPKMNMGVVSFQARYHCTYEAEGADRVVWRSSGDDATVFTHGEATFTPADNGGTVIDYKADMDVEIDAGLMGKMLGPVIAQTVPHEIRSYVKRMIKALDR